jgi:hypothetical protein
MVCGWIAVISAIKTTACTVAEADDVLDADGKDVLDFWQAQEAARNLRQRPKLGAYSAEDTVRDYIDRLEGRASWHDTKKRGGFRASNFW